MNYGQCLDYLQQILASGVKFGLENVRTVLEALGQPHEKYPSILVAGTNGKGSVCAMLASVLFNHGFRVGLYTSPHLIRVEERIKVGDDPIPTQAFCRQLTFLRDVVDGLVAERKLESTPTYFEMLTCLAFLYFKRRNVDIAVLEVGMGGRLDATNVVTPLVSVISSVSRDHEEFLGRTLGQIAFEKAGIIKPAVPVVCGVSRGRTYEVIRKKARELNAPLLRVFDEAAGFQARRVSKGYRFSYRLGGQNFVYTPSLAGGHQGRNAAVVIAVASVLNRTWKRLEKNKIIQGIRRTRWPGRLETVSHQPLVILDGAHNEEGARALREYVRDFLPRPLTLVFGIMRDKRIKKVARLLFPLAKVIFLTSFPYKRAASPEEIRAEARGIGKEATLEPDARKAIRRALELTPPSGAVLVTGSLFLVGEAKRHFPEWP
ncbi:MAG: folylpolyglutamate synthase/dihydrofolate synthase family protein [Clostridiales bacterium]|nr:folylpolyglutamate synthase/dihydrofolate synthase family protein [Clostridiales bacterium]